jgi:hypothetical protein
VPGPLWFLADPRRIDLALVDPVSRRVRGRYEWTSDAPRFIRGTRPDAVTWHEVAASPGWFAGEGWALSPELAGVATRDGTGLSRGALRAESPLKYFGRAPSVAVRAGSTLVGTFAPDRDFQWRVALPLEALVDGGGVVTIATDATFQPAASGASDARTLGLRTFGVTIAR